MKPLQALILATLLTTAAHAQAPAPADPNGWVKEIATANKLLAAGYVDAAQKDFELVIQRYAANSAGVDRAWLGLSKIHMARYDFDQAKVSLEEILRRNTDAEAVTGAKSTYRQLKQEADGKAQQAQKALQFLEMQYATTSWLNPFAKLFIYLDLKKARTAAEAAQAASNGYDPHYFIDDVAASAIVSNHSLSASDFQPAGLDTAASATAAPGVSVHTPAPSASATALTTAASSIATTGGLTAPAEGVVATIPGLSASPVAAASPAPAASAAASLVVSPSPAPAASAAPSPAPSPIVISASPAPTPSASAAASATLASGTATPEPDLMTLQRGYQEAYRKLQEALTMGNQTRVVALNAEYQKALEAYRAAAAAGRR